MKESMTYEQALAAVKAAMEDQEAYYLAASFAEGKSNPLEILADAYHQASCAMDMSREKFEITVIEYVLLRLDDLEYLKSADDYEDGNAAEKDGFFWLDEFDKFVKLNF